MPKALRSSLGLVPGRELDIRAIDGRLEIEVAPTPMRLVRRGKGVAAVADRDMPTLTASDVRDTLDSVRR
jgi:hypothetical protein